MNEIVDFLEKSKIQYLATIGLDRKPKVRPFQFMFEEGGKLWFCTSNQKEIYKELQSHSYVEICASSEKLSWLRLSGKVIFADNISIKEKVFEVSPLVKGIYKQTDNPAFEVFYLDEISGSINEIGKKPNLF